MKIERRTVSIGQVREELADFERTYGVPTSRLEEAFRAPNGQLAESPGFARWSLLRTVVNVAEARACAGQQRRAL